MLLCRQERWTPVLRRPPMALPHSLCRTLTRYHLCTPTSVNHVELVYNFLCWNSVTKATPNLSGTNPYAMTLLLCRWDNLSLVLETLPLTPPSQRRFNRYHSCSPFVAVKWSSFEMCRAEKVCCPKHSPPVVATYATSHTTVLTQHA